MGAQGVAAKACARRAGAPPGGGLHQPTLRILVLLSLLCAGSIVARADSVCTERAPTPDEQALYSEYYALFLRAAPGAPEGWSLEDSPASGTLGNRCKEYDGAPLPLSFGRRYTMEAGAQERDERAMAAYTDAFQKQQALQEKNKAAIAEIDGQIAALVNQSIAAAQAQKFEEMQGLAEQQDALMKRKMDLMGLADSQVASDEIQAEENRDRQADFRLALEAAPTTPREGEPFPTEAGQGRIVTYEEKGVRSADVTIDFVEPGPRYPVVRVHGDPARVRELVDAADLTAIAQRK